MSVERIRALLADKRVRIPLVALLVAGGYFLVKALLPEIDLQDMLEQVASTLGEWTYLAVGVLAFLETGAFVGLVAPGETFVILAGAVAGVGETSLVVTIGIVWFSAWAGDTVSFFLGRRLGRGFIVSHGARVRITPERLQQVEAYFQRHGGKTILIGRFIGLVRALAPFTAGTSGMSYRGFVPFSVLGTGLWGAGFTVLGFLAARSLERAADVVGRGTFLFGVSVAVVLGIVLAARFLREPENRERLVRRMEERRGLRPLVALGRRLEPQARFAWQRFTPGRLGLELTTLLAVVAVGLFVFIGYITVIGEDPGPTATDRAAFDVVRDVSSGWLRELNELFSDVGARYVVLPLALLWCGLLAMRGRWAEAVVGAVATAVVVGGVSLAKELIDRPRPPAPLGESSGNSYPSGHAAQSIVFVWVAVMAARELRPRRLGRRLTLRTLLIAIAIALAAAVGSSRVYLRVHYLSDVLGGWAFGASVFALTGIVAMIVTHLRQNSRREADVTASADRT